jgi:hypothetical protein
MSSTKDIIKEVILIVSFILILFLLPGFLFLFGKIRVLSDEVKYLSDTSGNPKTVTNLESATGQPVCTTLCQNEIDSIVANAIASHAGQTKTGVTTKTPTTTGPRTAYIPLGPLATTTSTDWVSIPDSVVYVDALNDYGKDPYITWEVSLKVAHGNGKAFARIYDETHKIAVDGSELSTTGNSDFSYVSSDKLRFWNGRNLYKVQIKSLNSYEVTLSGPKIKVVY